MEMRAEPANTLKAALALAVVGLAATGCNRGGEAQPSATIASLSAAPSVSAVPTSTTPLVKQIDDGHKFCNMLKSKGTQIGDAITDFWSIPVKRKGWTFADPDVQAAQEKLKEVLDKNIPFIEGSMGPGLPESISAPVKDYLQAAKEFGQAVSDQEDDSVLNPAAHKFSESITGYDQACGFKN